MLMNYLFLGFLFLGLFYRSFASEDLTNRIDPSQYLTKSKKVTVHDLKKLDLIFFSELRPDTLSVGSLYYKSEDSAYLIGFNKEQKKIFLMKGELLDEETFFIKESLNWAWHYISEVEFDVIVGHNELNDLSIVSKLLFDESFFNSELFLNLKRLNKKKEEGNLKILRLYELLSSLPKEELREFLLLQVLLINNHEPFYKDRSIFKNETLVGLLLTLLDLEKDKIFKFGSRGLFCAWLADDLPFSFNLNDGPSSGPPRLLSNHLLAIFFCHSKRENKLKPIANGKSFETKILHRYLEEFAHYYSDDHIIKSDLNINLRKARLLKSRLSRYIGSGLSDDHIYVWDSMTMKFKRKD